MKKILICISFIFVSWVVTWAFSQPKRENTELFIFNPFRVSVKMEVKCDHDYYDQKYKFYKIIDIPGKGNYKLSVPYGLHKCEIWPLKIKLF